MKKRFVAFVIVLLTVLSIIPCYSVDASSSPSNKDKLKQLEDNITQNKNKAKSLDELAKILTNEIKALDDRIAQLEDEIEVQTQLKKEAEARLKQVTIELRQAEEERETYKKLLEERLLAMYMSGSDSYADMLYGSKDLNEFIGRLSSMSLIVEYDQEIYVKCEALERLIRDKKEQIEIEKAKIVASIKKLENSQAELDRQRDSKTAKINESKQKQAYLEAMIKKEEKDAEELRRAMAEAGGSTDYGNTYFGGSLKWPLPGKTRVSSPFGYRIHPIYKTRRLHKGTDIPASSGTKILSPANGKVTTAAYNGSYGYYVVLDLGKDPKTGNTWKMLFAHCSKLDVRKGQVVTQGTVLARVGSTGDSTGPHLHFELTIAGSYKDVTKYVTPR